MWSKLSFKAVICGFLAGVLADVLLGAMLGYIAYTRHVGAREFGSDPNYLAAAAVVATLVCVLVGYVTARIAKQFPFINSSAVGVLGAVLCLVLWSKSAPLWYNLGGVVTALLCPYLGAVISARRWA